jgi:hypothetical protein
MIKIGIKFFSFYKGMRGEGETCPCHFNINLYFDVLRLQCHRNFLIWPLQMRGKSESWYIFLMKFTVKFIRNQSILCTIYSVSPLSLIEHWVIVSSKKILLDIQETLSNLSDGADVTYTQNVCMYTALQIYNVCS